jgi:hypothetical protein
LQGAQIRLAGIGPIPWRHALKINRPKRRALWDAATVVDLLSADVLSSPVSNQEASDMRRIIAALLVVVVVATGALAQEQAISVDTRPTLLQALDGRWLMKGDVLGKPVTYDMVAAPTLQGTFTEMHMNDVQVPSEYEARVFIGAELGSQLVIAHWLDNFGAKSSIPHGTGQVSGNTIQFTIPYESGPFRDTLIFRPEDRSWSLVIEASQPDGSWKHFARYEIRQK